MSNIDFEKSYVVLQGWMTSEMELKGSELIIYGIIYGFSQTENQRYTGGLKYLTKWTNSSKQDVISKLKSLEDKGFIKKYTELKNNVKFCEYEAIYTGGKNFLPVVNDFNQGGKNFLLNNISDTESSSNITELYIIDDSLEYSDKPDEDAKINELFQKNKKQENNLRGLLGDNIFRKTKSATPVLEKKNHITNNLKIKVNQLNESEEVKNVLYTWLDVLAQNKKQMSTEQLVIAVSELDRATNDDAVKVEAIKKATLRVYRSFEWTIEDAKKCLHKDINHLHNGSTTPTKTLEELNSRSTQWENEEDKIIPDIF